MRRMNMIGLASMAALVGATVMAAGPQVIVAEPERRQRKQQAPRAQYQSAHYPDLNRSKKWAPERSYADAAATTLAMGVRTRPLSP